MPIVTALSGIKRIGAAITAERQWTQDQGLPDGFHVNGDGYVDILTHVEGQSALTWTTLYVVGGIQHNFRLYGIRPPLANSPIASGVRPVWI